MNRAAVLEPGVVVAGDFRIDDVVGDGGMGVVYKATQLSLDRTVALKLITTALSQDFAFRERFRQEGRVQARLEHPHIIDVYAAGESEHGLYLAMRLVHGPSLGELVGTPSLTIHRTIRLLSQIGSALDAAHDVGLVHRDIKPQNILIDERRDHSYLADFGVTKARGGAGLTQVGQRVGTLTYMAPEQFRGQQATELSDIYSFGAVVYECLVGTVPYPMPTEASLITAHLTDPVPRISEHRPELPAALDETIEKAMAKNPDDRYAKASELMHDVARAAGVTPAAAVTVAAPPGTVVSPTTDAPIPDVTPIPDTPSETILSKPAPPTELAVETPPPLAPAAAATSTASGAAETTLTPVPESESGVTAPEEPKPATEITPPPSAPPTELAAAGLTAFVEPPVEIEPEHPREPDRSTIASPPPTEARPKESREVAPSTPATAAVASTPAAPQAGEPAAPAAPARERPARAPTARSRVILIAAGAIAVLAVVGFFAGHASAPSTSKTVTTASHQTVSAGDVTLQVPTSWTRASSTRAIPGLVLTSAVALAPSAGSSSGGMVAGHAPSSWPSFLPSAFRKSVGGAAVRNPELVRLGTLDAYRYDDLKPRGFAQVVTAYAVPQQKVETVVACYGSATVRSTCDGVAATLKLASAKPYSLDPSSGYAATVNGTMRTLNSNRSKGAKALSAASTQSQQATAASSIQAAYATAARRLDRTRTSAFIAPANNQIVAALNATRSAYGRLAAAARSGDRAAYDKARNLIRTDEAAVRARVQALKELGFKL